MKMSALAVLMFISFMSGGIQASAFPSPMALNFYGYTLDSNGNKIGEYAVSCSNGREVNLASRKAAGDWCYGKVQGSSERVMCVSKKIDAAQQACRQPVSAQIQMADIAEIDDPS